MALLREELGWQQAASGARRRESQPPELRLTEEQLSVIAKYNALDRLLYERIAAQPAGAYIC